MRRAHRRGTPACAGRGQPAGAPQEALACALALAETLNARAPNALAGTKELLSEAPLHTLARQLEKERDQFVRNLQHPNAGEGIAAFLEKRTPRYR